MKKNIQEFKLGTWGVVSSLSLEACKLMLIATQQGYWTENNLGVLQPWNLLASWYRSPDSCLVLCAPHCQPDGAQFSHCTDPACTADRNPHKIIWVAIGLTECICRKYLWSPSSHDPYKKVSMDSGKYFPFYASSTILPLFSLKSQSGGGSVNLMAPSSECWYMSTLAVSWHFVEASHISIPHSLQKNP